MKEHEQQERDWLKRYTRLPGGYGARLTLIGQLQEHAGLSVDVARGARERLGAELADMLAGGLAEEWAREATNHVASMRAGKFQQNDPIEFRDPETQDVIEGRFEYEEDGVARVSVDGRRREVPAGSIKAVPEFCNRSQQFAELCRAASDSR